MAVELNANLRIHDGPPIAGEPVRTTLTVTNQTEAAVSVVNPDMGSPPPELNWSFGQEAYQISLLLSFGILSIEIVDPAGQPVPRTGPETWATPILMPRLALDPGATLSLATTRSDHFAIDRPGTYRVAVEYGDQEARARAATELVVAPPPGDGLPALGTARPAQPRA